MAAPTAPGLTPKEVAFLAENEMIEVIPRQRLESLQLLGGPTPAVEKPPQRATIPLWLALLLKRQQRANIVTPPWLTISSLTKILDLETSLAEQQPSLRNDEPTPITFTRSTPLPPSASSPFSFNQIPVSPPFAPSSITTAPGDALPYHWLEISQLLLDGASDDLEDADNIRRLTRDLRECRAAKMRGVVMFLEGNRQVEFRGVGAMEVAEHRSFVTGVIDGLRKIGASKELSRREREEEERLAGGGRRGGLDDDSDEDMAYEET